MFSSDPFSQVSSINVFSSPNSFLDYQKDEVHLNYIDNTDSCPAQLPPAVNDDVVLPQQYLSGDQNDLLDLVVTSYKMKMATSKKDGHSKICSRAEGGRGRGRGRRVRLSIDISRKFFCLQDLLGFDKSRKTLDWLLTKSLTAIKDLVEQKSHCSSSNIITDDESKALRFLEIIKRDSDEENSLKNKSLIKSVDGKAKKKKTPRRKSGSRENLLRQQSRAEARARSRERTKEKNRGKKLDEIEQQNGYKNIIWVESVSDGSRNLKAIKRFKLFSRTAGRLNDLDHIYVLDMHEHDFKVFFYLY